jgi:hypothetical protein
LDTLQRILMVISRLQLLPDSLLIRRQPGHLYDLEVSVTAAPAKLALLVARIDNLVEVRDVEEWTFAGE